MSPRDCERICREAAPKSFEEAARSLNIDWRMDLDRKQIQRWAEALGGRMARERDAEAAAYKRGRRPVVRELKSPAGAPQLLVIGVDGGRVQYREKEKRDRIRFDWS